MDLPTYINLMEIDNPLQQWPEVNLTKIIPHTMLTAGILELLSAGNLKSHTETGHQFT